MYLHGLLLVDVMLGELELLVERGPLQRVGRLDFLLRLVVAHLGRCVQRLLCSLGQLIGGIALVERFLVVVADAIELAFSLGLIGLGSALGRIPPLAREALAGDWLATHVLFFSEQKCGFRGSQLRSVCGESVGVGVVSLLDLRVFTPISIYHFKAVSRMFLFTPLVI